jgi:signal transduction histidine kinase
VAVSLNSKGATRREWVSWAGVSLLVVLCCVLAILQYRWIGEVAQAERQRLHEDLQSRLNFLRRSFDDQVSSRIYELVPAGAVIESLGREQAYLARLRHARETKNEVARRVALAIPEGDSLHLEVADQDAARFAEARWPEEWRALRDQMLARMNHEPFRVQPGGMPPVVDIPRFDPADGRAQEWLIVELNLDTLRTAMLPPLLNRYLASEGRSDYDAEILTNTETPQVIYRSGQVGDAADASVALLDLPDNGPMRGRGPAPGPPRGFGMPPERRGPPPDRPQARGPDRPADRGQWTLRVHHRAGSLEAIVAQARWRNVMLSGAILLLILMLAASLLGLSRQRQRMAELEMNFVAGVSHELRTPLTVIRTAAFNLRGKIAHDPGQVERYGQLIQEESEKLTALVERVLRYGSAKAGQVVRQREPVDVANIIEQSLRSTRDVAERSGLVLEQHVSAQLPVILADQVALRHAVQNLVENAIKYGNAENGWVGIFADAVPTAQGSAVEIRVVDRGPGIPADEREHIFDPFFRGRRALADQVHGTGLGLNLVKKIVEAHGGTIQVNSQPMHGAEFVVRIPAAPPEFQHEFAHSLS